jgi:serine-type D-Ala-D-Ala carboxypeptidase
VSTVIKDHHFVGLWGELGSTGKVWLSGRGQAEDRFDLSSLTKPILTSTLLMMTCERSQWSWDNFLEIRVSDMISELQGTVLKDVMLRHLWEHRSGLAAHIDFLCGAKAGAEPERRPLPIDWTRAGAWQFIVREILKRTQKDGLSETASCYSDLGFLLLGLWLERFYDQSLDELWSEWKQDHGLSKTDLSFFGLRQSCARLVPTESRHTYGEVNDNNAYFLGGVAPHAGLHGTAQEIWAWLNAVNRWTDESPKLNSWNRVPSEWPWPYYCGWDRPADLATTTAGAGAPHDTIGHLGYTGTALWWSPSQNRGAVLLSNRIHPKASPANAEMIKFLRREFFTALWQGTLSTKWQIPISKNGST